MILNTKFLLGRFQMMRRSSNGIGSPSQEEEKRPSSLLCGRIRITANLFERARHILKILSPNPYKNMKKPMTHRKNDAVRFDYMDTCRRLEALISDLDAYVA